MKAVVAAFNQEKALVGAFSVITNLRMELFGALVDIVIILIITVIITVHQVDIMLDKLIIKDVQLTAANDDNYFVFEDQIYNTMLCFSRDTEVANKYFYDNIFKANIYKITLILRAGGGDLLVRLGQPRQGCVAREEHCSG